MYGHPKIPIPAIERVAFEKWAQTQTLAIERITRPQSSFNGEYLATCTQCAWLGWLAARGRNL